MGLVWSQISGASGGIQEKQVLMLGLEGAGKTTILYSLTLNGETVQTIPTMGINTEKLRHNNFDLVMKDIGGPEKIRLVWHHYITDCSALIFVVDSSKAARLEEAASEMFSLLKRDTQQHLSRILIFANKKRSSKLTQCVRNRRADEAS